MLTNLLSDLIDRLDELIIAVVAASSGGFIGGWMALRAANAGIQQSTLASKEERQAAAIAQRRLALVALEAELRLNAALLASEETDHSAIAPAWHIPFRDAYVVALPYLAGLPAAIQQALQDAAVESSHYTVIATRHNTQAVGGSPSDRLPEQAQADQLRHLAPDVSDRFLAAANQLRDYLKSVGAERTSPGG